MALSLTKMITIYPKPPALTRHQAAAALEHMRALLPAYRELCGAAPYFYAAGEVQRLENQLVQVYSDAELERMTQTIHLQLEGLAHAIRAAKGRGVDLDA